MQNMVVHCARNTGTGCLEIVDRQACLTSQACRGPAPVAGCDCAASNVGASCGMCGGVVQCDGSCSKTPQAEACNNLDEDCNGEVDNGFRVRFAPTSFGALKMKRPGCDAVASGRDCDVAAHRVCNGMGCVTSGILSQSTSASGPPAPELLCVIGEVKTIPFATLKASFAACDGVTLHEGFPCLVATHRYCVLNGFGAGFGPIEWHSVGAAGVSQGICLPKTTAFVKQIFQRDLTALDGGCQYATIPLSYEVKASCNAAAHRYCRQQGFESGYGPVEASGDTAIVVCVAK